MQDAPMSRTHCMQENRKIRFEEAFQGWTTGRLTQAEVAMLLGQCERSFRRHVESRTIDKPKAVTAAAHKLARLIYTMLTRGEEYTDQGQDYYEERYRERVLRVLSQRAAKLGMLMVPIAPAKQPV